MAAWHQHPVYEFGGFYLDAGQRLVFRADGTHLSLTSRAFDTLAFMVEHPGELLATDRLMDAIWPDVIVEENNLQQCISALRRTLGERPKDHRFIVTSRARGYRFVAPVRIVSCRPGGRAASVPTWLRPAIWGGGLLAAGILAGLLLALPQAGNRTAGGNVMPMTLVAVPTAASPVTDPGDHGHRMFREVAEKRLAQLGRPTACPTQAHPTTSF